MQSKKLFQGSSVYPGSHAGQISLTGKNTLPIITPVNGQISHKVFNHRNVD